MNEVSRGSSATPVTGIAAVVVSALGAAACYGVLHDPAFGDFRFSPAVSGVAALVVFFALRGLFADLFGEWATRAPGFRAILDAAGPVLGLAVVLGLFWLSEEIRPYFFSGANFKIVLTQTVVVAIGALGMTLIIVSGGIDLSCGSVVALASVAGAVALVKERSPAEAAAVTILTGGAIGLLNGAIIAGFRLMPFIVTLGMMGVARGAAKWLADNQTVNPPETPVNDLMNPLEPDRFLPLPPGVWLAAGLAGVTALIMRRTVFGRHIFAIGSNEDTARLCGVRVQWNKVFIYSIAGLFFGTAGLMQFSRLTQGDPTAAIGLELDIIAAVVIGGASLSGGTGSVFGAMVGALIMAVLRNGSNQMGWPNYMQEIIIGAVIVLAVGVDRLRRRREGP